MSLGKFFERLWKWVADFFGKIGPEARKAVVLANCIVERIKNYADSPTVDVIAQLIPGGADDAIVLAVRTFLGKLLRVLAFIRDQDYENENEANRAAVLKLKDTGDATANKLLRHGIASALTEKVSTEKGKPLPWSESIIAQEYYHTKEANNIS